MKQSRSLAASPSHVARRARGFTLVEMVIVIGIIVMLAGLTIAVGSSLRSRSETRATEGTLLLLDTAMQEWNTLSERQLSFGTTGVPAGTIYELDEVQFGPGGTKETQLIGKVMAYLLKNPEVSKVIAQINPKQLGRETTVPNDTYVIDSWDQRIQPVFPGRLWQQAFDAGITRDADGTIRTTQENIYGICTRRRICFVSTGPDGKRGDLQLAIAAAGRDQALVKQATDNLSSYPLLMENP